jgi:hypothetical protein
MLDNLEREIHVKRIEALYPPHRPVEPASYPVIVA